MHIKQVIIRGFKTYKDQVSLDDDFHPGVNVVVGFNGSGKSNFFNAILFVISDHFGALRPEVRKSLLHEGAGPTVLTAFVELVFDNTDRRLPIDKDEVRVRRTIGAKKDDYSLEGKNATKSEVFDLLESCGFSKTNPYYIVQQGKISELTLMDDRRRLELIKEISGAGVYDARKAESEKLLEEMQARRLKTDEVVGVIAQRIKNLEEEQRELVEYQQLERSRRCLEYELTDRDWTTARQKLDELEVERRDLTAKLNKEQRSATALRSQLADVEAEVQQVTLERQRMEVERQATERTRTARIEELTRAKLELDDETRRAKDADKARAEAQAEVKRINAEMGKVQKEMREQEPQLAVETAKRRELMQRKQIAEAQREQFLAKQGRRSQYSSIQQRNKALGEEIKARKERKEQAAKKLKDCEAEIKHAEVSARKVVQSAEARRVDMERLEQELVGPLQKSLAKVGEQLEQCAEKRRLLAQDREKLAREKEEAERQEAQCTQRVESTMSRPQRNALTEVRRWVKEHNLEDAVYGTLLENMEMSQTYAVAVESTAGNSLFNLLVRDDDIASQIVAVVRKSSLGSIVCTPMNQITARPRQNYPKIEGVKPLVDVISCPPWASLAVHQVFGRTVICSTLELCDEVSKRHGLDAITLDGDKVSSRGPMTGGYQDPSRFVRVTFQQKARLAGRRIQQLSPELEEAERKAQEMAAQLESLHSERRRYQDSRSQKRTELAQTAETAQEAEGQVLRYTEAVRRHRERRDEVQNYLAECEAAIEAMEAEKMTDKLSDLSNEEEARLRQLSQELREIEAQVEASEQSCHTLQRALKGRELHLQDVLRKRLHDLESELIRDPQVEHEEQVLERSKAVTRLQQEEKELDANLQATGERLSELDVTLASKGQSRERITAEDRELQAMISLASDALDDITTKLTNLEKKKNEADEKLRSLTILPADMVQFKELSPTNLEHELRKTNKALGKFEHVNKKAIDQFTMFTDQLKDLEEKRKEIDESRGAVEGFMRRVDEQREETLLQTLQKVDQHFRDIFSDLVRGGCAKIRMLKPGDVADGTDADNGDQTSGVRIEVSFTGQNTSFLTMAQLSGGQKTVVAIALIFAIQRLEPAPFYLFDEIDAALDTQYRTAVARLISRDAKNAQMVITTFRPEIIETADQFYRVYQKNRVSRIECVKREEAKKVIEEQTRLERPEDA
mmetsp:Transcript_93168/g.199841  ORF Transcript_93168/g.199841 Transcript_93168/m.199841 type:complete len:1199 (-) Transcript_93168:99-3695(-)